MAEASLRKVSGVQFKSAISSMYNFSSSSRKVIGASLKKYESASASGLVSATPNELPLTYGVELEVLLAIKRKLPLEFSFITPPPSPIDRTSESKRRRYSSQGTREKLPELHRAHRILQNAGLQVIVSADKHTDFTAWGLVTDISVAENGPNELRSALPDRVKDPGEWTAAAIELVSRVFHAPPHPNTIGILNTNGPLIEISKYISALSGTGPTSPYGIFTNHTCGLHVHVGLDPCLSNTLPPAQIPLDVLQHLSYILIQFESSISALHPRDRRGLDNSHTHKIDSNLMGLRQSRHVCDSIPLPQLHAIEQKIFDPDMDVQKLAQLMSDSFEGSSNLRRTASRFKFVNFTRLLHGDDPSVVPTIEFRQHAGTAEYEEVGRWILFVVGLVRAAERKARTSRPASPNSPTKKSEVELARRLEIHMKLPFARRQGNKYKVRCQGQVEEFGRLFDLMEMGRRERDYWFAKYREFNPEEVVERDELVAVERKDCPVCRAKDDANAFFDESGRWRFSDERAEAWSQIYAIEEDGSLTRVGAGSDEEDRLAGLYLDVVTLD